MSGNTKIKDEFIQPHNFLNYCRECIVSMVEYADEKRLSNELINYKSDSDRISCENFCKGEDSRAEKWLIENGYKDVMFSYYYKHLFFSLLVDFSNYFTASLEMSLNGNTNVAWAILRKPLQEILAYFEWLYVDKDELLGLMIEGEDVKLYEIMSPKLKDKRRENIDKIQAQIGSGTINMFEFRYSYDDAFTLNGILQATNHLVTTRPALKTSPSGLNFVFLDDDIVNRNIGFYYTTIPYVMLYTMDIIMKMFVEIANLGNYTEAINKLNLSLKSLCAMKFTFEKAKELFDLDKFALYCPECGKKHNSDKVWIDFSCEHFQCEHCGKTVNTYQYIFDFETIEIISNETEENDDGQA